MFMLASLAMAIGAMLESAINGLIVPIIDQALAQGPGHRTPTIFGLQNFIPDSGIAALETISVLLLIFTAVKGGSEYFSTYLMARIGQSAVLRLRQDLY